VNLNLFIISATQRSIEKKKMSRANTQGKSENEFEFFLKGHLKQFTFTVSLFSPQSTSFSMS